MRLSSDGVTREVTLLTGFPSFAARHLCAELVKDPNSEVIAVVHPKLAADATDARNALPPDERWRLTLIEGDAAAMDLGLSGIEWKELTSEVDRIHAMAQVSYLGAERALAEQVNIGGAREILEFARACPGLRSLVFHSTASVSGDRTGLVLEQDLQKDQNFRNVVEETLARAEKMMRAAMPKLPICVVRPTTLVGDSRTGEVDRLDGPYFLVLLIVTSPPDFPIALPARADGALHLVPVDYFVRAAIAIGRDPRSRGLTFHIGDPSPLTARRVFELVAAAGGRRMPRGFIPANITKALLRTPGFDRLAKSPRAFVDSLTTDVTYSFANTTELLGDTDVRCPPFESYVEELVEYVQQRLRDKRTRDHDDVRDPLG